jgi:hypothetical protein
LAPPGTLGRNPWHLPRLTPGPLGCKDAAEPFVCLMFAENSPGSIGMNDYGALLAERLELAQPLSLDPVHSHSMANALVPHLSLNLLTLFSSVWVKRATADWSQYSVVRSSPDGKNDAETRTSMPYHWETDYGEKGLYRVKPIETEIIISNTGSWVVDGQQSDELLRHEQVHADISLLVGYEELRELVKLRAKSVGHLGDLIGEVQRRIQRKANALSEFYDSPQETHHGVNKGKQAEWEAKIDQLIHNEFAPLPDPPAAGAGSHRKHGKH